jgi:ribose 5-phosphate isomerase B
MEVRNVRIALGSDHAGFRLKEEVAGMLREMGHEPLDLGTYSDESVDYPDFALKVAESILAGEAVLGILVCGTGLGMAMSANKVPGIRAAAVSDTFSARAAREHNDANVLCIGARVVGKRPRPRPGQRLPVSASFEGGRHVRRVGKIEGHREEVWGCTLNGRRTRGVTGRSLDLDRIKQEAYRRRPRGSWRPPNCGPAR